jgi:CBS domain-containing protein
MNGVLVAPTAARSTVSAIGTANDSTHLTSTDPAFLAMTDFRRESPIAIEARSPLDDAAICMNRQGVHALLVKRAGGVPLAQQAVGLITYYDIERCRLHRWSQATIPSGRAPARVEDVMTSWDDLAMVSYESLQSLKALDLYERFQGSGLTHVLVIETLGVGLALARGLISRAALTMRLHRPRIAYPRGIVGTGAISAGA